MNKSNMPQENESLTGTAGIAVEESEATSEGGSSTEASANTALDNINKSLHLGP